METIRLGDIDMNDTAYTWLVDNTPIKVGGNINYGEPVFRPRKGDFEVSSNVLNKTIKAIKGKVFQIRFNDKEYSCKLTTRRGNKFYFIEQLSRVNGK